MIAVLSVDGNLAFVDTETGNLVGFRDELKVNNYLIKNKKKKKKKKNKYSKIKNIIINFYK